MHLIPSSQDPHALQNGPWAVNTYNNTLKQFSAKAVIHRLSQKSAVTNMPEGCISPYMPIAGERLPRRALNAVNRYDQLLVVWNHIPVPTTGRFPDLPLNTHNRLPNPDRISGCT